LALSTQHAPYASIHGNRSSERDQSLFIQLALLNEKLYHNIDVKADRPRAFAVLLLQKRFSEDRLGG
jgi:hypothetical protein